MTIETESQTFVEKLPPLPRVILQAVGDWWRTWPTMIILNVLLVICWVTIVLGPPATFAVYYVTYQITCGENLGFGGFKTGLRLYFWKSWRWMLLNVIVIGVLVVNFLVSANFNNHLIWQFFYGLALALWLATQFYALPIMIQMKDERLVSVLRNGFITTGAAPIYTWVIISFAALVLILSVVFVVPFFIGCPIIVASLGNRAVRERFMTWKKKIDEKTEKKKA